MFTKTRQGIKIKTPQLNRSKCQILIVIPRPSTKMRRLDTPIMSEHASSIYPQQNPVNRW